MQGLNHLRARPARIAEKVHGIGKHSESSRVRTRLIVVAEELALTWIRNRDLSIDRQQIEVGCERQGEVARILNRCVARYHESLRLLDCATAHELSCPFRVVLEHHR